MILSSNEMKSLERDFLSGKELTRDEIALIFETFMSVLKSVQAEITEHKKIEDVFKIPNTSVTLDANGVRLYYDDTRDGYGKWIVITWDRGKPVEKCSSYLLNDAVDVFTKLITGE